MKKATILALGLTLASTLSAHDFWVNGHNEDTFKACIGYGHNYPAPELIAKERTSLFAPLAVMGKNGTKLTLKQEGKNYEYVGKNSLEEGTYILSGEYKPTFWSKTKDNKWKMGKTRADLKENTAFCELAAMHAKSIINISNANDNFVTKPIGQKLEIVPLKNPSEFKVGEPFTVQVLLNKKPLKATEVKGTYAGYASHTSFPFYGTTDLEGKIDVIALRSGEWILLAKSSTPYEDTKKCDEYIDKASLTFTIK